MIPLVSVVVPTYRRDDLLDRCLAALAAQEFDPAAYEVNVADDAASMTTKMLVAVWDERSQVRMRYLPVSGTQGPAAARNRGWHAARGAIVAFTDDDCVPQPDWLRAGTAAFSALQAVDRPMWKPEERIPEPMHPPTDFHLPASQLGHSLTTLLSFFLSRTSVALVRAEPAPHKGAARNQIAGVMGRIVVPLPDEPTDYERDVAGLEAAECATANCFYRRGALEAVGGFDEAFPAAWREDSDLFFTLVERGERLVQAPDAVVVHPVRPAKWGASLQQQQKSMYNALLYKKHPALYRARVQATPPWRYYGIVGAAIAAIVGGRRGRRETAFAGAALWLVLTGRFCAERLRHTAHTPGHIAEMAVTSALIPPLSIYWRLRGALKYRVFFL
jgi:GT2 family glycosyltransferase